MKILVISRWFPYPPNNGSKIRIFNLLKQLSLYHEIHLLSFATEPVSDEQIVAMRGYCRRVEVIPFHSFHPNRLKARLALFSLSPRSVIDTYNVDMARLVTSTVQCEQFGLVIASELDSAPYALMADSLPKLLDELQVTTFYNQFAGQTQPLKKFRYWLTWVKLQRYLAQLTSQFSGCTTASNPERDQILAAVPLKCPLQVIPNGVDIQFYNGTVVQPQPDTLIYSGALTFDANFDAVAFFLQQIWPLIRTERPQAKLSITGKTDGVPLEQLPLTEGVEFTGYLDDIRPAIAGSWINIVPLRIGGGTRLKILESLALGTPVIATRKGAEGLDLVSDRDFLIADDPVSFAAAVLNLLQNPDLREILSSNGRQAVTTRYDWHIIGQQFNHFVEQVAIGKAVSTLS